MPLASDARRKAVKARKGRKGRMGCTLHELSNTRFLFPSACELQIIIFCIYNPLEPPWPSRVAVVLPSRLSTRLSTVVVARQKASRCVDTSTQLSHTIHQTSSLLRASCEKPGHPRILASPALTLFPPRMRPGYRCIATVAVVAPAPRTLDPVAHRSALLSPHLHTLKHLYWSVNCRSHLITSHHANSCCAPIVCRSIDLRQYL